MSTRCQKAPGFQMPDIVAVILAGGAGRRMGGDKPCQRLHGHRLIDIATAYVEISGLPFAVAVRRFGQIPDLGAQQILDADVDGPLGGLLAALDWANSRHAEAVITVPCDMPLLPEDLFERLRSEHRRHGGPIVAASGGRVHPVCAFWPVSCRERIQRYVATDQRRLIGALNACGAIEAEWAVSPSNPFVNLNSRDDLERAAAISLADASALAGAAS